MARLVLNNAMSVNGAFEAPSPDEWLVLDSDSNNVSLEQFLVADAMLLGRKTYEGLAAVWPLLVGDPTLGTFADRLNSMPKYVASRTLSEPLPWNATLIKGNLAESVSALKDKHQRTLIVSGAGGLAHALVAQGLVDEFWFW
jgi:dihydrofolate reductase